MTRIVRLDTRLVRVPLTRPWAAEVTSVSVVATTVALSDGSLGYGFSWTPQIGAEAAEALLRHDIAPMATGLRADPEEVWPALWNHLHEAGGGGMTTIALAGLDLALWDAQARARGIPVCDLIGRRRDSVAVYGSGVNLHYEIDELLAQVDRWIAQGLRAVKIKVGKPDLTEDLDRVGAVRERLGPERQLMLDANQRWDLDRATTAMDALAAFDPAWIEEPLRADDLAGHAELARRTAVPIAVGENLHTAYRFEEYLRAGAVRIVQPNVIRVGGITPFLRIAAVAADHGATLHPHLLPELSGPLALSLPHESMVEDVEDARFGTLGALRDPSPVTIHDGRLSTTPHLGLGLRFADPTPPGGPHEHDD